MNKYNSFCVYCVGGIKNKQEINECNDKFCPFYSIRFGDLSREEEKEIALKLLGEAGIIA